MTPEPPPMPREAAFYKRTSQLYSAMRQRFREKLWKSGRNAGHVRVVGRDVPFNLHQFRVWMMRKLGGTAEGTVQCRYCPTILTAMDVGIEHVHPASQGGSLGLENLDLCCQSCNQYKGGLTEAGFLELKQFLSFGQRGTIQSNLTFADTVDIERRLRGGVVYHKSKKRWAGKGAVVPAVREQQAEIF